ncbi:MAG: OmpA family protein [Deltaproteobacteria bacterium]|nr:OmpA family protein [Deltaproteobacteria bacterium]
MMKSALTAIAIPLVLFVLLSACAAPVLQPMEEKTSSMKITIEEINKLEEKIEKAKKEELDVLSPRWFAKAETSCGKAKSKAEKGAVLKDIREDLADATAYLIKAEKSAAVARTTMAQAIESRRLARVAGATELGRRYDKVEERFLKLTAAVEKNRTHYTEKNAPKVSEAFRDLELIAIKNKTIGEVGDAIQQAEESGAKKYAPQALETAQRHFNETNEFITANRYATDEMQKKAAEAMFFTKRALVLSDLNKRLEKMTPEETSLWMEGIVKKITARLSARDSRDMDMDSQVTNILDSITSLQENNRLIAQKLLSTQNELEETKTASDSQIQAFNQALASYQSKSIQDQKTKERILAEKIATETKLESERQFNQKFIEIQSYFRPNEADVYKRGNQLIIRLKGMKFPVGQAFIMQENYRLLSKVQRAIGEFENPSAVIEGHTDSTGIKEANDILSRKRASAVKEYLIANGTLPADKIFSRGYGSEKPLASNATPEGREANRRIDVIVTPDIKLNQ